MDMDKTPLKILGGIIISILVLYFCILALIEAIPAKLEGAWEVNDEGEIIFFYDNDICVCDGEEMIYRVLSNDTISLDGEIFEYEITDKRKKKMTLDEKY